MDTATPSKGTKQNKDYPFKSTAKISCQHTEVATRAPAPRWLWCCESHSSSRTAAVNRAIATTHITRVARISIIAMHSRYDSCNRHCNPVSSHQYQNASDASSCEATATSESERVTVTHQEKAEPSVVVVARFERRHAAVVEHRR